MITNISNSSEDKAIFQDIFFEKVDLDHEKGFWLGLWFKIQNPKSFKLSKSKIQILLTPKNGFSKSSKSSDFQNPKVFAQPWSYVISTNFFYNLKLCDMIYYSKFKLELQPSQPSAEG